MLRILKLAGFVLVDESIQPGGSFKWRGVSRAAMSNETNSQLVTFSSGNHGVAVALAGRRSGRRTTVIVPIWAEEEKVQLLLALGCTVIQTGNTALECEEAAYDLAAERGAEMPHPFRCRQQIEGYTSLWAELAGAYPEGADFVVPVGGGALLAAGVLHRKRSGARYHLFGVEPTDCACIETSLNAGRSTPVSSRSRFAPALNVNQAPEIVLDLVNGTSDLEFCRVGDEEMATAAIIMASHGMNLDPAAAAGVACVLFGEMRRRYRNLVVLITGRGAKVSAERLREDGILCLSDREIEGIAPAEMRRTLSRSGLVSARGLKTIVPCSSRPSGWPLTVS